MHDKLLTLRLSYTMFFKGNHGPRYVIKYWEAQVHDQIFIHFNFICLLKTGLIMGKKLTPTPEIQNSGPH